MSGRDEAEKVDVVTATQPLLTCTLLMLRSTAPLAVSVNELLGATELSSTRLLYWKLMEYRAEADDAWNDSEIVGDASMEL